MPATVRSVCIDVDLSAGPVDLVGLEAAAVDCARRAPSVGELESGCRVAWEELGVEGVLEQRAQGGDADDGAGREPGGRPAVHEGLAVGAGDGADRPLRAEAGEQVGLDDRAVTGPARVPLGAGGQSASSEVLDGDGAGTRGDEGAGR